MVKTSLVLSYCNINGAATGGTRRIQALVEALTPGAVLCQPAPAHPEFDTVSCNVDLGTQKHGINWGIFNYRVPGNAATARRAVAERQPAAAVLCSIWCYHPIKSLSLVKILDAHDVNAVAIAERFGRWHPFTRIVKRQEARVVREADHVFVCSAENEQQMRSLYGIAEDKITVVPNGVDAHARPPKDDTKLDEAYEAQLSGHTVLFFMGKLDYQPNTEALRFLNEELMPRLEDSRPGKFKLLVCGGPKPSSVTHPSIIATGRVDSVLPYLRRADICLAPIFSGSGTRLKLLEYMAAEKPIVSTAKGAEGLGCTDGQHLFIAEQDAFTKAVLTLADDPRAANTLASVGAAFVKERFDWRVSQDLWAQTIQRVISTS